MFQLGDLEEVSDFDDNESNHAKVIGIVTIRAREQSERVGLRMMNDGVEEMLYNCTPNIPYFYPSDVSTACDEWRCSLCISICLY